MGLPLGNDGKPVPSQLTVVNALIPKGAKNVEVAKDFLKYFIQPKVNNDWLKVGLGRNIPVMPSVVKNDPWWLADPHRKAYTEQGVLGPTVPAFWAFNPAYAEVQNTHVWSAAWADVMQQRDDAAGGGGQGVQADRGDLREIPDRAELSGVELAGTLAAAGVIAAASDCRANRREPIGSRRRDACGSGESTVNDWRRATSAIADNEHQ